MTKTHDPPKKTSELGPSTRNHFAAGPDEFPAPPPPTPCPVPPQPLGLVWTKGRQRRELAHILSEETAVRSTSNLKDACTAARACLLVTRSLTSFDLCSVAVPDGFEEKGVRQVAAAVGGGPHSRLAAAIALRISTQLGVPGRAVTGYREPDERDQAQEVLTNALAAAPGLDTAAIEVPTPAELVSSLPDGTLLVVGASGGSWFQRQFFGPGAKLRTKAPGGVIVVRAAPTRVFQVMQELDAYGPHMRAADALRLTATPVLVVADQGKLMGLVHRDRLLAADPGAQLGTLVEESAFLKPEEEIANAEELLQQFEGSPLPVVTDDGGLVGAVSGADLPSSNQMLLPW